MRVSINVNNYSWGDGPAAFASRLKHLVRSADEAGLDTVWVPDHLIQADPSAKPSTDMLEAYTTLGFLAGETSQVRLGAMVTAVSYRPPGLLVKAVTTLDVLSGGRAWLGIGAGYLEREAREMGLPLPSPTVRFEQLEETLRLALQMWAGDDAAFEGSHHHLERPVNSPQALRRPHPPILIGGTGERKTLRLVAQYADACNLFDIPDGGATITGKLATLARHCEAAGRPYEEIEKTVSTRLHPEESSAGFAQRCCRLAELGIEHVVVLSPGPWTEAAMAPLAGAVPAVQGM